MPKRFSHLATIEPLFDEGVADNVIADDSKDASPRYRVTQQYTPCLKFAVCSRWHASRENCDSDPRRCCDDL